MVVGVLVSHNQKDIMRVGRWRRMQAATSVTGLCVPWLATSPVTQLNTGRHRLNLWARIPGHQREGRVSMTVTMLYQGSCAVTKYAS